MITFVMLPGLKCQGVRVYTHRMPIASLTTVPVQAAWTKAAQVIVDWSRGPSRDDNEDISEAEQVDAESLLRWIRTYPQRSSVHVFVRGAINDHRHRRFRQELQSLGCTVTTRSHQTVLA